MNRTTSGRVTQARGLRHQIETYFRQATELGSWTPVGIAFWVYSFTKTYQDERNRMNEERVRPLREERRSFERVERQLIRELDEQAGRRGLLRRILPRRAR